MADISINLVLGQIREATRPDREKSLFGQDIPSLWASQPGMIRAYKAEGGFAKAWKLYSSSNFRVTDLRALLDDAKLIQDWEVVVKALQDLTAFPSS